VSVSASSDSPVDLSPLMVNDWKANDQISYSR